MFQKRLGAGRFLISRNPPEISLRIHLARVKLAIISFPSAEYAFLRREEGMM
jgi:hypothetical protein